MVTAFCLKWKSTGSLNHRQVLRSGILCKVKQFVLCCRLADIKQSALRFFCSSGWAGFSSIIICDPACSRSLLSIPPFDRTCALILLRDSDMNSAGYLQSPNSKRMKLLVHLDQNCPEHLQNEEIAGANGAVVGAGKDPEQDTEQESRDEEGPVGLKLKRSSSLLELIQSALLEGNTSRENDPSKVLNSGESTETRTTQSAVNNKDKDKRKATNFSAILLRIGSWERAAKYEGELVVKCYFAKRKLVWEVLEGGLKSKIEVQWSDITAIRASCPKHGPGTLEIQISKPPLFHKESNPQPRKHTLWQASSDFTDKQATINRRHLLKFSQGVLDKHYEKLIQADPRLAMLSKKPFISGDRPYFDSPRSKDDRELGLLWQPCYMPRGLSNGFLGGSFNLPSLSTSALFLQSMVPEFEHFDPEERLNSSNSVSSNSTVSDGSCLSSSRKKLREIADYLLCDTSFSALQDPMNSSINFDHGNVTSNNFDHGNVTYFQPRHVISTNPLVEGAWYT